MTIALKKRLFSLAVAFAMVIGTFCGISVISADTVNADDSDNIYVRCTGTEYKYIDVDEDITAANLEYDSDYITVEVQDNDGKKQVRVNSSRYIDENGSEWIGITTLSIKDKTYKVYVYERVVFQAVSSVDDSVIDPNIKEMQLIDWNAFALYPQEISGYSYDSTYGEGEGYTVSFLEDSYGYYYLVSLGYIKQEGTYTLTLDGQDELYVVSNATDANGKELTNITEGDTNYLALSSEMSIDGERVFCIEPTTYTAAGSKYEREEIDENIKAAIVTNLIAEEDSLDTAVVSALVWKYIGNNIDLDTVKSYSSSGIGDLTDEQKAQVSEISERVDLIYNIYVNNTSAEFTTSTKGASIKNGQLVLDKNQFPKKVVLKAGNKDVLELYSEASIEYPDGVAGVVDVDAGTLTLTLDKSKITEDTSLSFALIPETAIGKSYEYISSYGNQNLAMFKLAENKKASMKLVLDGDDSVKDDNDSSKNKDSKNAKNSKDKTTSTGDRSNISLSLGLLATSLAAIIALLVAMKRRKTTK